MNVKSVFLIVVLASLSSLYCSVAPKAPATLPATLSFSAKEQSMPCADSQHTACYFTTSAQITKDPIKPPLWGALVSYLTQIAIDAGTVPCSRTGCTNTSAILQQSTAQNITGKLEPSSTRAIIFS